MKYDVPKNLLRTECAKRTRYVRKLYKGKATDRFSSDILISMVSEIWMLAEANIKKQQRLHVADIARHDATRIAKCNAIVSEQERIRKKIQDIDEELRGVDVYD